MPKTLPYSREDYLISELSQISISLGLVQGIGHVHKFGRNPDIGTTLEAIWNGGGDYTGQDPTSEETIDIVSSSISDDAGSGQGAWTVEVFGLDGNYDEVSEIVTLNGQIAVTTTQKFLRLNRATVRTAGTLLQNAGSITADQSISGDIMMVMPVGYNQTMIAAYTIPANKNGIVTGWFLGIGKKQASYIDGRLMFRPENEVFQVNEEITIASTGNSSMQRMYIPYKGILQPKTDIKVMALADSAGLGVTGGFDLVLVDIT